MNSVIQCLLPLCLRWAQLGTPYENAAKVASFFCFLHTSKSPANPKDFRKIFPIMEGQFPLGLQQDAHEYLISLLNCIVDPLFEQIFSFQERTYIRCSKCGKAEHATDSELAKATRLNTPGVCIHLHPGLQPESLQNLIDRYFQVTTRRFRCYYTPTCDGYTTLRDARCQHRLLSPVNALIIELGRFSSRAVDDGQVQLKNQQAISFDTEHYFEIWDPDPKMGSKRFKKPLLSIVCHYGPELLTGHYVAYVRHPESGYWYKYDDDSVTLVSWIVVKSEIKDVYLLFFGPGVEVQQVWLICVTNSCRLN